MIQTSTPDDVLRYVYEETTEFENTLIEDSLMGDAQLVAFYLNALETKQLMNRIIRTPSERSIQNILAFSRNYAMA